MCRDLGQISGHSKPGRPDKMRAHWQHGVETASCCFGEGPWAAPAPGIPQRPAKAQTHLARAFNEQLLLRKGLSAAPAP